MADNKISSPDTGGGQQAGRSKDRVFHTVTACVRCRTRKTRCDPSLPRCDPCERANAPCEYYDSSRNRTISRTYITSLQDTVRKLSGELKTLTIEEDEDVDHESMAKAGGLIKFNEKGDTRFMGPSSGIALTRFVMEFAKQSTSRKAIRDIVPVQETEETKQKFDAEIAKPTAKVYPLISSVAAPNLPRRDLMAGLVQTYVVKAQYALPLLHEPTFRLQVDQVYEGSQEPTINFQVRLVIAISLQKIGSDWAGLADSYYLAALPYLNEAIQKKDLSTLQCFALIAQYSLLTPTRTAAYWIVGMAAKLCQELGLCDESTIEKPPAGGVPPNVLEIDMRRRLFWIITSMEFGLAHSLGRPSAFGVSVDNVNVGFFELCDDEYITAEGLKPGHYRIMKKCISVHFLRMRLLQAQIRRTLYLKKRPSPKTESDPWFSDMLIRIDNWVRESPKSGEGSGLDESWFKGRRNTMIIMMYRPSPQIPVPSFYAAQQCYDAATFNIHLQKHQVETNSIDITWIFTQAICMALNTVLWTISFPGIRQQHSVEEVTLHIEDALTAIGLCAERWPGVVSAQHLYRNLVEGCLKSYDNDRHVRSPGSASVHDFSSVASQTAQSPVSTTNTPYFGAQSPQSSFTSPHQVIAQTTRSMQNGLENHGFSGQAPFTNNTMSQGGTMSYGSSSPSALSHNTPYSSPGYEGSGQNYPFPTSHQPLPSWDSVTTAPPLDTDFMAYSNLPMDNQPWLASLGDTFGQYATQPYGTSDMYPMEPLGEQDQLELLASLEEKGVPLVSPLAGNIETFYNAYLP